MPNGFHGSKQEWERLEAPLRQFDPELQAFADQHAMRITRNEHNWPSRSLHWGHHIERAVQISLEHPGQLTWSIWVYAWQDRGRERYWKKVLLGQAIPLAEIAPRLAGILQQGRHLADAWSADDLEFATTLPS